MCFAPPPPFFLFASNVNDRYIVSLIIFYTETWLIYSQDLVLRVFETYMYNKLIIRYLSINVRFSELSLI